MSSENLHEDPSQLGPEVVDTHRAIVSIVFANVYALSRSYGFAFAAVAVPALIALGCLVAADRPGRQDAAKDRFIRTTAP